MSTTQITNPADIICGLKAAVTALECYHQMDVLKRTQQEKQKKTLPPMFMMIPIEEKDVAISKKKSKTTCKTNVSVKDIQSRKEGSQTLIADQYSDALDIDRHLGPKLTKVEGKYLVLPENPTCLFFQRVRSPDLKFPEMRNGYLHTRCYCVHRDGLQDTCPLTQCQGQPECLFKPWPICPPAKYLRCRYPNQYPMQ